MKSNAAKLPGIGKNQRAGCLVKNKMIMRGRFVVGFFRAQLAGHSQVQAEPKVIRKSEQHLFAMRLGACQRGSWKRPPQKADIRPAKDPCLGVQFYSEDFVPCSGVPLFAIVFDFGKFRHKQKGTYYLAWEDQVPVAVRWRA